MSLCLQDDQLKALVQKLGTSDWKYIASYIPVSSVNVWLFFYALECFFNHYFCLITSTVMHFIVLKFLVLVVFNRVILSTSVSIAGISSWILN